MTDKCPECKGSGYNPAGGPTCSRCDGIGEVDAECAKDDISLSLSEIEVPEKILHAIFSHQAHLQTKVLDSITSKNSVVPLPFGRPTFVPGMTIPLGEKEYFTKEFVLCIIDECSEILGWINWKMWKRTRKSVNIEEVKFEIIDMLHFWVNLCLIWGISPEDVYRYYFRKQNINIKRQDDGY